MSFILLPSVTGINEIAPYAFLFGAAGLVSLIVALIALLHRQARGALPLIGLMLANASWAFGNTLMLAAPSAFAKLLGFHLSDFGFFTFITFFLMLVLDICGYSSRLTPRRLLLLWLVPALALSLSLTNAWHGWLYSNVVVESEHAGALEYTTGVWFAIYYPYTYALIGVSVFLLLRNLLYAPAIYRRQLVWLLGALALPLVSDFGTAFGLVTPTGMSLTPIAIAASGIVMALAVTRRTLLDLVPVAQSVILETLQDGVLVIDAQGRLVELNRAAQQLLDASTSAIGQPLAQYAPHLARACAHNGMQTELALDELQTRYVDLRVLPLRDYRGQAIGHILALHDITEHRRLRDALAEMNAQLENKVLARTQELQQTIEHLHQEIAERQRVETSLRAMEESLARRVTDQSHKLAALYDAILFGGQGLAIPEIQAQALALVLNVMRADAGAVMAYDADAQTLSVAAPRGLSDAQQMQLTQLPVAWLLQDRVPRTVLHLAREAEIPAALYLEEMSASLSAPAYLRETPIGALLVFWRTTPSLAVQDIALFSAMADQLAILIENARLRERAEASAARQERRRLARDLHDSVTQSLHSLVLAADVATNRLRQGKLERLEESLAQLTQSARQSLKEMRLLLYELRLAGPDQIKLTETLPLRLEAVERRAGIETEFCADDLGALAPEWNINLHAIAMEALNNSLKHAQATRVAVRLCKLPRGVALEISDNGRGMNGASNLSGGMGLTSMRERAERIGGTLTVTSAPAQGTRVQVRVEDRTNGE
ncbi:MAG: PAS domain-containing protein [Chloroflexi bacterium]|nr:PAS domain-containing protein [Chloroflexota bacterium]